jgi:hypothetical protein
MKQVMVTLLLLCTAALVQAQDKEVVNVQEILETKNFIFKAETVTPARGRLRQLTSEYDLVVKPDTVVSFLPYFGRAYSAPINPADAGIKFTSVNFDYSVKSGKKNSWDVAIKPSDAHDVQDLYLTVFDNGRATLRVNSVNRQTISFNGYVSKGNAEKKAF